MAKKVNSAPKMRSTFFTSMFVIALVLFFLGLFSFFALFTRSQVKLAQEEFAMMITLPDHASNEKREAFQDYLENAEFSKRVEYISKDDAANLFMESLGEDFLEITDGVNPLPPSLNVYLNPKYVNQDSFTKINKILHAENGEYFTMVKDVVYPIEDIEQIRKNFARYLKMAIAVGLIVALIAFFIINSTIRLSIYAKRLLLRSMQLIGATNRFIRTPFVKLGTLQGFLGGLFASLLLVVIIMVLQKFSVMTIEPANDIPVVGVVMGYGLELVVLLGGIIIFGALLGWLSSRWAVNRFLNRSLDQIM